MSTAPLRELIAVPVFRQWAVANVVVRIPVTMTLLSFVLAGEYLTGSVGTGALLAGVSTLSSGFAARWRGAQLDRVVLKDGLTRQVLETGVACAVLAVLVWLKAPLVLVFCSAIVMGVLSAAITGGLRALLIPAVPSHLLESANSVDAVLVEVAFVSGPVVAGLIGIFFEAPLVIAVEAALLLVGVVAIRPIPASAPNNETNARGVFPVFIRGARSIYLLFFLFGLSFGIYDAALPDYVSTFGWKTASSGLVTTMISLGSGVSGLLMANVRGILRKGRWMVLGLFLAFALAFALPVYTQQPLVFGLLLFFIGLPIAPLMAVLMLALQHIVPKRQQAESFALVSATILVAAGAGMAMSGALLNSIDWLDARTLLQLIPVIPLVASLFIGLDMAMRHRAHKPQSMGFPLDPDIKDPDR